MNRHTDEISISILTLFTIAVVFKNRLVIKTYVSTLFSNKNLPMEKTEDIITFRHSNAYNGFLLYLVSLPTIWLLCLGFFMYPPFLLFGIPLTLLVLWGYSQMRKNLHDIILSSNGIKYEPFKQIIMADTLAWSEIEEIGTIRYKGVELVLVRLKDRARTPIIAKIGNLSFDLNIGLSKFENSDSLKQAVFEMYGLYKNKNTKSAHG